MRVARLRAKAAIGVVTAYAQVLGASLNACPAEVRELHQSHGTHQGEITVVLADNPALRCLVRLMGFPAEGTRAFTLVRQRDVERDVWARTIGSDTMVSHQWMERGFLAERLGPVTAITKLTLLETGLTMQLVGWRFLGLPLPQLLAPQVSTFETGSDGHYKFDVKIGMPVTGTLLAAYRGYLRTAKIEP